MGELFYLDFKNDASGEVQIDEPIGYAEMDFNLQQKDKGYGRDISFSGGEAQFNFVNYRNHYLDKLLYFNHFYGFESKVDLIIRQDGYNDVVAELDFATAVTDDFEYIKCKVIQQSSLQIVKRRKAVKVDLFSNKDVDGNAITPLNTDTMLLLNKPLFQTSRWEQSEQYALSLETKGGRIYTINPAVNITKSDIDGTQNPFEINSNNGESMQYLESATNLKKLSIKLNGISGLLQPDSDNGGKGTIAFSLEVHWGQTLGVNKSILLSTRIDARGNDYAFDLGNKVIKIDSLSRGDKIWVFYGFVMNESTTFGRIECFGNVN